MDTIKKYENPIWNVRIQNMEMDEYFFLIFLKQGKKGGIFVFVFNMFFTILSKEFGILFVCVRENS